MKKIARPSSPNRRRGLQALPEALRGPVVHFWEALVERAGEEGVYLPTQPEFVDVLYRVCACSEFVAHAIVRQPRLLRDLMDTGDLLADYSLGEYAAKVAVRCKAVADDSELADVLRQFRQREMVRIVWRDLAGWAPLEETLGDLSRLADACLDGALKKLHRWLSKEYGVPRDEQGVEQSLLVLGMGKLGAMELNVSSDIDLIFAYPEDGKTRRRGGIANEEYFTRLGQRLIQVIGDQTAKGFVFRVDMRLRPYGDSGPLVMSFDALEEYYQSQGREWERYAMIKARVVAGDPLAGKQLLEMLRPFVYRRYLDFGAFESLRAMKTLIQREVSRKGMEDNIKLGPGGIREVEFIGQAFQLVRGGRESVLRERGIMKVLQLLADLGYLPAYVTHSLLGAYRYLRRVENRLQAYADRQVHVLPRDEVDRIRLAFAMGHESWESFAAELQKHRRVVHEHFEQVFAAPQVAGGDRGRDENELAALWQGVVDERHALETLERLGFDDPSEAVRRLRHLRDGHAYRALSATGRERMDRLMPMLLGAVRATSAPAKTLPRVVNLVETIAGRIAYLSLLIENPMAMSQLVKLCAASPWIALQLTHHPLLLDELLDPRTLYMPLDRDGLRKELNTALRGIDTDDLEQQMEALRHFKQSNVLRVAAAEVAKAMRLMVVSDHLTEIAEVVLREVLAIAWNYMVVRHGLPQHRDGSRGKVRTPGFAVIAYGKLGGIELSYGSDLDLVFLHDGDDEGDLQTVGPRSISNSVFFARLGQRIIHMLNTLTPSGVLYEVDMRLRPSGASGLLVSSLDAFAEYQRKEAWTWEHQALVRARPVAGDASIARRFTEIRREVVGRHRDPHRLRSEVRDMRERMRAELERGKSGQFDIKQGRGGITDIEFLVQYGVLRSSWEYPDLLEFTDNIRQLEALARNGLMSTEDAALLGDAYRAYRARIHELTLQEEPAVVGTDEFLDFRGRVGQLWHDWLET